MKGTLDCIPCLVRQAVGLSQIVFSSEDKRQQWVKETLNDLSQRDFLNCSPPEITQSFFQDLLKKGNLQDPYEEIKSFYNREIMEMESELAVRINGAKDPLKEALILAIAGNIIDFGTPGKVTRESVWEIINKTEKTPLNRDQSSDLFQDLSEIKELLYLGDNCGEIVFDKLFIQELQKAYPLLNITFAVRGSAILNDITLNDAAQTGMDQIVKVISNGDNAPGTRLDHCSQEFQQAYKQADLIISKGQGNLETLDEVSDKIIYFLFITKCPMISKKYSTDLHSLMCIKNLQE